MIKMRKKSNQPRLQTVFFSALSFMIVLFLSILLLFFFHYFSNILTEQEIVSLTNQASYFQTQTDTEVEKLDDVSININYSTALHQLLGKNDLLLSKISLSDCSSLLHSINGVDLRVDQINIYDLHGNILRVGESTTRDLYINGQYPYVDNIADTGGKKIISTPYPAYYLRKHSGEPEKYISLYRTYSDNNGKTIGVVETALSCKNIFRSITTRTSRSGNDITVRIYTEDGTCIYPYDSSPTETFSYFDVINTADSLPYYTNPDTSAKEIITSASSSYTGWTIVLSVPEYRILAPVYTMFRIILVVGLLLLLFGLLSSYWLSHKLISPIRQFQQEINETALSTLDKQSDPAKQYQYRELFELNQSFFDMRCKLKNSMDELLETRKQEIKSRTMALQSQINPHFYYNSLASVIALAENDQPEEVIRMCRNLTKIMRYVTNTNDTVTVQEEIDYINQYLDCMKVRYQSSLNYIINIDPAVMKENIPRLLIQPLVENAIKYGIDSEPPWGIAIHGYTKDDGWRIEVMDSGRGFSEEALKTIEERIRIAKDKLGLPEMQINGMGTLNVYLRWHLYAGDTMIFDLGNTSSGHAIVTIGRTKMSETTSDKNSEIPPDESLV